MGLENAHKGYEYQDLISALYIIEQLLISDSATFKIDQKESQNDKFDDLTIILPNKNIKRQVKYSEDKILKKADLSSDTYDLALDTLFNSWKEINELKKVELRICLAWEYIEGSEELDFLEEVDCYNIYEDANIKYLKININKIWKNNQLPIASWRRLRSKAQSINREEFAAFLDDLILEVNLPKASLDIANPDTLENCVISKLRKFGVGKYPNNAKTVQDVVLNLTHIVKSARSKGEEINLNSIIYRLGLKNELGNIQQVFEIDKDLNVLNEDNNHNLYDYLITNQKVLLLGEPGSGKSWFIQNFINFLNSRSVNVVQHYCYTGIDDIYEKERITINVFLANLINDIINIYPDLIEYKKTKYGVDIDELQVLISNISEETIFVIDGLDHIGRVYNFHKSIIKEIDTQIINLLSNIEFPRNVKVILVSQPIADVTRLYEYGYKIYDIVPWDMDNIEKYLVKNNIEDINLNWNTKLSDLLLIKSNGNPLYLTYLVNELKSYSSTFLSVELIEGFPPYSNNLTDYYDYIMSRIPENQKVPEVLSGSPFYLSETDLREITNMGNYVVQSLEAMQSILKYNYCTGGYTIYHESFRRYILERLEKNEVNINIVVYSDLIEWLKGKGFYKNRKSYLNLLILLFESKRYDEIIAYCNKEFVENSIFYGNNISSIKHNFEILIKTACIQKDYGSLIVCTELSNMIYSLEYSFDENAELYYWGVGLIHGFDTLKDNLLYEGKMALSLNDGLKTCYLCSKHDIIPEWEPYIDLLIETDGNDKNIKENEMEFYKYFICACLDIRHDMVTTLSKVSNEEGYDYRKIIIEEYQRREMLDALNEIIEKILDNKYWKQSILDYMGKNSIDENLIESTFDSLKVSDAYSDTTLTALKFYVDNIEWLVKHKNLELSLFINEIKDRNWYYNWLIYIAEVNEVIINKDTDNYDFEKNICKSYSWLIKDVEPFKGSPRTCDLYRYESIIYNTIKSPLSHLDTSYSWNIIIQTITTMSEETMTSFQGSTGGPLPTYKLLNLFIEVAKTQNIEVIENTINKKITKEDTYRLYTYLADYCFKYAIILSKARQDDEANIQFRQGVKYLLSYSYHKDRTLSHLLDSVISTYGVNEERGLQNLLKLKPLADAVVNHTDGRSTKRYQYEWFELLVDTNLDLALMYLKDKMVLHESHWIYEDSLEYLLCNCNIAPRIENVLYKTMPSNISERFIESYIGNIEWLLDNNFLDQARRSVAELVSRFGINNEMHIYEYDLAMRLKKLCEIFDVEYSEGIYSVIADEKVNDKVFNFKKLKYINRLSFDKFSYEEILIYIKENGIRNEDLQGLYYYLSNIKKNDINFKIFYTSLINICCEVLRSASTKMQLLKIINNIELDSETMAFIYMHMFLVFTDGWYNRFTETELFKKAHEYCHELAEEHFFEYIYNNFNTVDYSLAVGGEIINSLTVIDNENQDILIYWDRLFDIINYRLPGQIEFDWSSIIENSIQIDNEVKLFSLLLTRLKYGESYRYKWIISELDSLLKNKEIREKFSIAFIDFLNERDKYIDYSFIILLYLIYTNYTYNELVKYEIIDSLKLRIETENSLVNYLIDLVIGKNKNRIFLKYKNKYNYNDERTNYLIDLIKVKDKRISLLNEYDIDIGIIVYNYMQQVFDEYFIKMYRNILFNRKYSILIHNVYFYDILTKHMANEIDCYINSYAGSPDIKEIENSFFNIAVDDIRMLIAQNNSIIPRPKDLRLPKHIDDGIFEVENKDWIRIAYCEKWFRNIEEYKNNFGDNLDTLIILSGVGFNGSNQTIPFIRLDDNYNLFDENLYKYIGNIKSVKTFITTDIIFKEEPYLNYIPKRYLGIRDDVLYLLGIMIIEGDKGIVGVNRAGEEVLRYSRWEVNYYDDNDAIPYLLGSQLQIKKSKFDELCDLIGKEPYMYVNVFDSAKD